MSNIKMLIVEDNLFFQKVLKEIVSAHFPEIEIVGTSTSVTSSIDLIKKECPDLIIMDIHLTDGTAFEILKQVDTSKFKVIFITAYHEYMLEALQFSSVDFIFKPFDINEIILSIDKTINDLVNIEDLFSTQQMMNTLISNIDADENSKQIVLTGNDNVKIIPCREIIWGKANLGNSEFHFLHHKPFTSAYPLRKYESILQPKGFFRCHSHYLINTIHIDYVDPIESVVHMNNGDNIPLNKMKYDLLIDMIQTENVLK